MPDDLSSLNNIVISMRASADRLLQPLKTVLIEARDAIDRVLPLLPVALLFVLSAGCAVDLSAIAREMKKPTVVFESAASWSCAESMKIPVGSTVEECSICRNRVSTPQRVTIKSVPTDVAAGGSVLVCPSSVKVMASEGSR
jgi:hypothetical protein